MNKTLFSVGALIAGCLSLTACSGGGDGENQNVNAMSGRTFRLQSPSNSLGTMFIRVGDRIGSSNDCNAHFSFGSVANASSRGTINVSSAVKGEKGWDKCEFTFHIDEAEISEEVEFKSFFAIFLSDAGTMGGEEDSDNNNNNDDDGGNASSSGGGTMDADDYIAGIAPTKVTLNFDSNNGGTYTMEETTIYLDDEEEPVQTFVITNRFTVDD